eukprot:Clim_evm26s66 gene=Clim_evmTU26s66
MTQPLPGHLDEALDGLRSGNANALLLLPQDQVALLARHKTRFGETALHFAAGKGKVAAIDVLLGSVTENTQRSLVLEAKTEGGQTPLMWAAKSDHAETVTHMIKRYQANDRVVNNDGESLLLIALANNAERVAEELITKGADLTTVDTRGFTPVHHAVSRSQERLVRLMARFGASLEARDTERRTPLLLATELGRSNCALALVDLGADCEVADAKGRTVQMLATDGILGQTGTGHKLCRYIQEHHQPKSNSEPLSMKLMPAVWTLGFIITVYTWVTESWARIGGTHPMLCLVINILLPLLAVMFVYLNVADPGYVCPQDEGISRIPLSDDAQEGQHGVSDSLQRQMVGFGRVESRWCSTCKIRRPIRSKHCKVCGHCVYRMDHHCTMTRNCVGIGNHLPFILFLYVELVGHVIVMYSVLVTAQIISREENTPVEWALFSRWNMIFDMLVNVVVWIWFLTMSYEQYLGIKINMTLNERYNFHRYPHFWRPDGVTQTGYPRKKFHNPFLKEGFWANFQDLFTGGSGKVAMD